MPANETIPAFLGRQGQAGPGPAPFPAARPAGQFNVYDVARLCTKAWITAGATSTKSRPDGPIAAYLRHPRNRG
ncbi:MAG: hypothetical protein WKG07_33325 [Hymenobacter sp.]